MNSDGDLHRFTHRADAYDRARPGYPDAAVDTFLERAKFTGIPIIADIGSGTGIFSALFLNRGIGIKGIEPNASMRSTSEIRFQNTPNFQAIDGRAEATGLPDQSVNGVVTAQAFHWFDAATFRAETLRICKPPRWAMLVWNRRLSAGTPFLQAYEAFLREWGTDYAEISQRYENEDHIREFFGGPFTLKEFDNRQDLDRGRLRERILSSSYMPGPAHARHESMLEALDKLFDHYQESKEVTLMYTTAAYIGRVRN